MPPSSASGDRPRGPSPLPPFLVAELQVPSSPGSPRGIRRLHSAHALGAKPSSSPRLTQRGSRDQLHHHRPLMHHLSHLFQPPPQPFQNPQQPQQFQQPPQADQQPLQYRHPLQARRSQQFLQQLQRPQSPLVLQPLQAQQEQQEQQQQQHHHHHHLLPPEQPLLLQKPAENAAAREAVGGVIGGPAEETAVGGTAGRLAGEEGHEDDEGQTTIIGLHPMTEQSGNQQPQQRQEETVAQAEEVSNAQQPEPSEQQQQQQTRKEWLQALALEQLEGPRLLPPHAVSPRRVRQFSPEQGVLPPTQPPSQEPERQTPQPLPQEQRQLHRSELFPPLTHAPGTPQLHRSSSVRHDGASGGLGGLGSLRSTAPTRGRANSDASTPNRVKAAVAASANMAVARTAAPLQTLQTSTAAYVSRRTSTRKPVFSHGHLTLSQLIRDGPSDRDFAGALETARWKVADEGIKSELDGMSTTRIYIWLILLDAPIMPTDEYLDMVHRGPSPAYSKIRNDTFRTLTTDPLFRRRVSEASLIRLLNAVAWKLHDLREVLRQGRALEQPNATGASAISRDATPGGSFSMAASNSSISSNGGGAGSSTSTRAVRNRARGFTLTTDASESSTSSESGTYVQGMNVLAAPFLYAARSEAEAFVAFYSLLTNECPGYIRGAMDGVHKGLKLVDKVLGIVDPKLSKYLRGKGMTAEIYAFPSVLTLSACTPPLPEVLRLWDFLFAYGPHLNIICIVAQLSRIRDEILRAPSPNRVLRSFPALQADVIKSMTIAIIKKIPDDVYAEIVTHAQ